MLTRCAKRCWGFGKPGTRFFFFCTGGDCRCYNSLIANLRIVGAIPLPEDIGVLIWSWLRMGPSSNSRQQTDHTITKPGELMVAPDSARAQKPQSPAPMPTKQTIARCLGVVPQSLANQGKLASFSSPASSSAMMPSALSSSSE